MKNKKPLQRTTLSIRRSALSLLFVALALLGQTVYVQASSVGAAGTFAGRNYTVQTGTNLENTGTHFNLINNFETAITVDFSFEAPVGVSINVPDAPVEIAAGATYRFEVSIFTSANTPVGIFPISIVGRVISSAGGVEVSGSAGLNAVLTVQGVPPTAEPQLTVVNVTSTSFRIRFTNPDPEMVRILYALETSDFSLGEEIRDVASGAFNEVTFTDYLGSGLEPNTIYTVFAQSISSRPENSEVVPIQVTTLPAPPPEPDPEDPAPTDPPGDTTPPPPPTPPTTQPPASGGGGSAPLTNVLVIELEYETLQLDVFDLFLPPSMTAYVSVRNNTREQSRIDLTDRVTIAGAVNQNVTGRYVLTYTLRYTNLLLIETVTVDVVDRVAPQIISPSVVNVRVDDPFTYRLDVRDNYDKIEDLIITGFPSRVDTSTVGSERFTIFVADRSGNRTPFLLTVNVRERTSTTIPLTINDVDISFEAVEGLFNPDNYRVEVTVAVNQPLQNSPSWTLFTGQELEASGRELVYVRLTDNQGNVLFGVVDIVTGRVLPILPDDNVITGDPWWRVLLRFGNVLVWIVPLLLVLGAWGWFFRFVAKRKTEYTVVFMDKGKVISEQRVARGKSATPPNEGPWSLPFNKVKQDLTIERIKAVDVVKQPTPRKAVSDVVVDAPAKKTTRKRVVDETKVEPVLTEKPPRKAKVAAVRAPSAEVAPLPDNEPVVQAASTSGTKEKPAVKKPRKPKDTVVVATSAQGAASTQDESLVQAASTTPAAKKPRRRRKAKEELYVQIVALEEDGVMDDDLLGAERLNLSQKTTKDVIEPLVEEVVVPNQKVDERQIDLFDDETLTPPVTPKKK